VVPNDETNPVALQCPQCGGTLPITPEGYTVCRYCGSSLIFREREISAGGMEQALVRGIRLKTYVAHDAQGTGLEVFRMLVPTGWQLRGGCQWLLDNPSMPAVVSFQVWNPHGGEAFEILPNMNLTWSGHPAVQAMHPVGSRCFGAEVRPPMEIEAAFRQLVLPRYRAQVDRLQVVSLDRQPQLPQLVRSEALTFPGGTAQGGKVRIRYGLGQGQFEEEIYARLYPFGH